jgi:hypothetical protein
LKEGFIKIRGYDINVIREGVIEDVIEEGSDLKRVK